MPTPQSAEAERLAPQIGTFGFDEGGMNRTVAPGDDFYEYANGTWAKTTPIPADKSNYGMFTVLEDLSKKRTQEILAAAEKDPKSKIGTALPRILDAAKVEAKGMPSSKTVRKETTS